MRWMVQTQWYIQRIPGILGALAELVDVPIKMLSYPFWWPFWWAILVRYSGELFWRARPFRSSLLMRTWQIRNQIFFISFIQEPLVYRKQVIELFGKSIWRQPIPFTFDRIWVWCLATKSFRSESWEKTDFDKPSYSIKEKCQVLVIQLHFFIKCNLHLQTQIIF